LEEGICSTIYGENMSKHLTKAHEANVLISAYDFRNENCDNQLTHRNIRFETQELDIEAISLKMVEPQLEEDKAVDVVMTTLWARPIP
jgi:hypothetical protein